MTRELILFAPGDTLRDVVARTRNEHHHDYPVVDDEGRLIGTVDAYGNTNSIVHDLTGRTETVFDRQGNPTTYGYDERGNVTTIINALGHVTHYTYDGMDNETSMTDALGHTMIYTNDLQGNRLSVTDPRNNATTYSVDGLGNLSRLSSPDTGTTANAQDAAGNLLSSTDAKGQSTSYTYDALNQRIDFVAVVERLELPTQRLNPPLERRYRAATAAGAVFNYDLYGTRPDRGDAALSALTEARLFDDWGVFSTTGLSSSLGDGSNRFSTGGERGRSAAVSLSVLDERLGGAQERARRDQEVVGLVLGGAQPRGRRPRARGRARRRQGGPGRAHIARAISPRRGGS